MLTTKLDNPNYRAKIVKIDRLEPHPNADKLLITVVDFQRIIVGLNTQIGDLFVYFPLECQINAEFVSFFNGYSSSELNIDKTKKGFFSNKARVKTTRLRGEISEGYLHPLSSFNLFLTEKGIKFEATEKNIGTEFDSVGDLLICQKYVIKQKGESIAKKQKEAKVLERLVEGQLRLHADTEALKKNMHKINPDDLISVSYKLHGCVKWDTIIQTKEMGKKTIKEIVENRLEVSVLSFDLLTGEPVYAEVDEYYFKENDGQWYEIELEDGTKLEITENNKVWMPKLNCYREAKSLKIGDELLVF